MIINNVLKSSLNFVYDKQSKRIINLSEELSVFLDKEDVSLTEFQLQMSMYLNTLGVNTTIGSNSISWNFVDTGSLVTAVGNSVLNVSKHTVQEEMLHQTKLMTLGEMTAGIIHDINNPLGFIISNLETIKYEVEDLYENAKIDEDQHEILMKKMSYIEEGGIRITEIIDGVKSLIHKEEISFRKEDIVSVIEKSVAVSQYKIKKQGVSVKINKENFSPMLVDCKRGLITQVIINLIQNAADAVENLPVFKKWIDISFVETKDSVKILIKDGGSGIHKEVVQKIFEPFYTEKGLGKGTGLGLSLSKQIMEAHSGKLYVDAECANTCFIMEFQKND